jgi:timeless
LRDVVETVNIFFKMLEKFCQGSVVVQTKSKRKSQKKRTSKQKAAGSRKQAKQQLTAAEMEVRWHE